MVVGRDRLLEPGEVEGLELAAEPDRMIDSEAPTRVAHQRYPGADRLAHRGDAFDVLFHMLLADAHLHACKPQGHVTGRLGRQLVRCRRQPQAGAAIDRDAVAGGAQQMCHRLAQRLALGIPQRGVDGGQAEDRHALVAEEVEFAPQPVPHALGIADVLADDGRLQAGDHGFQHLDAAAALGEQEALAGDPDVGVDKDQDAADAVVGDAACVAGRPFERQLDDHSPEISDAHRALLLTPCNTEPPWSHESVLSRR